MKLGPATFFLAATMARIAAFAAPAERISVSGQEFRVCSGANRIWMAGCNTPWNNWNDFGGTYTASFWSSHYQTLNTNKINSSRVWITCSGEKGITINNAGTVSGGTASHWADLDDFFATASARKVYVMATLMSFDHFSTNYTAVPPGASQASYQCWRNWVNSDAAITSYIDTYLNEFMNRYGANPYLWSIDLMNEPEWASSTEGGAIAWARFQKFFGYAAKAIHEHPNNSGVLVTVGMGTIKHNTDTRPLGGSNKVSDAALRAASVNDPDVRLDFWSPHYYCWQQGSGWGVPFAMTPAAYGLPTDRPAMVGETPNRYGSTRRVNGGDPAACNDTPGYLFSDFNNAYANGWQGVLPWTSNNAGSGSFGDWDTELNDATIPFDAAHPGLAFPVCSASSPTPTATRTPTPVGGPCGADGAVLEQSIRGFGASTAWSDWAGCGCGSNALYTANAAKYFGTGSGGIGLSMLRLRIPPDSGQWNGTFAPIAAAAAQGLTQIWSTAWTPPAVWKANGLVSNADANGYLLAANYQNYANYLRDYILAVKAATGVDLYAISPANEPDYQVSYDGCTWSGAQLRDFIKNNLGPTLAAASLTTRIIIPESFQNDCAIADPTLSDAAARNYLFGVGMHFYNGGPFACPNAPANGKEFWQTEKSNFTAYDATMTHGLITARWVHDALVTARFNSFHYWWLAGDDNNEGLDSKTLGTPKRFWAMGNWSKFVRPGWTRIQANANPAAGIYVSAFKNPATGAFALVAINTNPSASNQTFNLCNLPGTSVTPWITDSTRDLASQGAVAVSGGSFSFSLPAQSVVSFVSAAPGTPTPSFTSTSTSSVPTGSRTPSSTPSSTPSATPSRSPTASPSATRTHSPSATPSTTRSRTPSPTPSLTGSPASSPSPSRTPTPTPTASASPSFTSTGTPPPSSTPGASATRSFSPLPSASATVSGSSTPTSTPLASPASTPTQPASPTPTPTPSPTPSRTPASSPSSTPTLPPSPAPSSTQTPTLSSTPLASVVPSLSFTATSPATASPTPSRTATPSPTLTRSPAPVQASPTPDTGPPEILDSAPLPNPNPMAVAFKLKGRSERLRLKIWGLSMRLLLQADSGPRAAGWSTLPLPPEFHFLAAGTYYYTLETAEGPGSLPKKMLRLP